MDWPTTARFNSAGPLYDVPPVTGPEGSAPLRLGGAPPGGAVAGGDCPLKEASMAICVTRVDGVHRLDGDAVLVEIGNRWLARAPSS